MSSPLIFISHATANNGGADQLAEALEAAGFSTWVDHRGGIEPGMGNWDRAIREAIGACSAVILLMTPKSLASDICAAECLLALEIGRPLYIAYFEPVPAESIWLFIKLIQYADLRTDFAAGADQIIRVLRGDTAADLPRPVRSRIIGVETMRAYLPYLTSVPLIGRDADITALRGMIAAGMTTQMVAVGGTGKSRVAAEIALAHGAGAIWHRCDSRSQAGQILDLARKFSGLDDKIGEAEVLATLAANPPLIVIDNAEDVAAGSDQRRAYVETIHRLQAAGLPLLLTTRAKWDDLKPNRRCDLAPLTDLDAAAQIALQFASADSKALTPDEARQVARAARLHPRLIEIAVGQLPERRLPSVIRQLDELTHDDMQDALDEMIVRSVRQMEAEAKKGAQAAALLRRVTTLRGTFDSAAVMALRPDGFDDDDVEDALIALQKWGFVRPVGERYRIDPITSGALPPDAAACAAHFAHFAARYTAAQINDPALYAPILADWENTRAAIDWGNRHEPARAVQLTFDYVGFISLYILTDERMAVLAAALQACPPDNLQMRAYLHVSVSEASRTRGDYAATRHDLLQALALFEETGDAIGMAGALRGLGEAAYIMRDDYVTARQYLDRAAALFAEQGVELGLAAVLRALGDVATFQVDYAAARAHLERALGLFEKYNLLVGVGGTLHALGNLAYAQDDYAGARHYFERALPIFRDLNDLNSQAGTLVSLGDLAMSTGDYASAETYGKDALSKYDQLGIPAGIVGALLALGITANQRSDYDAARAYYERALPIATAMNVPSLVAAVHAGLGTALMGRDDLAGAKQHLVTALTSAGHIEQWRGLAEVLYTLSDLAIKEKDYPAARDYLNRSLELARQGKDMITQLNTLLGFYMLEKDLGNTAAACDYLRKGIELTQTHPDFRDHPTTQTWREEFEKLQCGDPPTP